MILDVIKFGLNNYNNIIIITKTIQIITKYFIHNVLPYIRNYKYQFKKAIFISMCDILLD